MNRRNDARSLARLSAEHIARARAMIDNTRSLLASSADELRRSRNLRVEPIFISAGPSIQNRTSPSQDLYEDSLQIVSDQTLEGQTISVDGKHFIGCVFRNCTIRYAGFPVVFETTQFAGCRFRFEDLAAKTIMFANCFGLIAEDGPEFNCEQISASWSSRPN